MMVEVEKSPRDLQDRLACLHQVSVELIQDITMGSLLERIATVASEQIGARYAAVGIVDEEGHLLRFISVGITGKQKEAIAKPPEGRGLLGALMHSSESIRVANIAADPRAVGFPKGHLPMTSFLGTPIRQANVHLGQIYLTDKIDAPEFSADDEIILETLAAYAAVAIANAKLYSYLIQRDHTLTRRNENLALLNELASTLASWTDIDQILDKTLTQVMDYLHLEASEIFLRQEESRMLYLVLHRGDQINSFWKSTRFQFGEGIVGETAQSGQPRLVDIGECEDCNVDIEALAGHFYQLACFPLSGRRRVLGVMCVAISQPLPLDESEIQFLSAISTWVGTVIENVSLSLQQRRLAILEERERIGMDLHDGIIQSIYAVGLTLEHARLLMVEDTHQASRRIDQAINDLNNTIRDIRAYILDLRPSHLQEEDLMEGIIRLVNEFRANTLVEVEASGPSDGLKELPDMQAVALFHICQEALANIAKHARSRHVSVNVWASADRALLEVSDDGRGFDPQQVRLTLGHGLSNMHTRAHNVGGEVDVTSEPGIGTTILAWVPFTRETK